MPEAVDQKRIRAAVREILLAVGEDPDREGLKETPDRVAYVGDHDRVTWRQHHERADQIGGRLIDSGTEPGDRVAVLLPDGPAVHACYLAVERVGAVIVGIGPRAGRREVDHLLTVTGASVLLAATGVAAFGLLP